MRSPLAMLAAAVLFGSACGGAGTADTAAAMREPEFPPALSSYDPDIDPADFVAEIDNPYMPLVPGTRYVYRGESDGERESDVLTVTHRTKEILGVVCVVVKDIARVEGVISEKTFDWFAQDRFGNVWYFGEDSHEYEDGKPVNSHGSWEAGVDGALPGIVMLGDPQISDKYRQEYYAGEAEDLAQILKRDGTITVPFGSFTDVLVTKDWSPLEPKLLENKHYAEGIGVVYEEAVKGADEYLELVSFTAP